MKRLRRWVDTHRVSTFVLFLGVTSAAAALLWSGSGGLLGEAQLAKSLDGFNLDKLRVGIWLDYLFIVAYAGLGWAMFSLIRDPKDKKERRHASAWAGIILVAGAAGGDAIENLLLRLAIEGRTNRDELLSAMRAAGLVKWGLLIAAAASLLALLVTRAWRPQPPTGLPTDRPPHLKPKLRRRHRWDPPSKKDSPRIGVCLSGGGIRSAAFSLGGLQALREKGKLDEAQYLAAVSGGGYVAAGWALSDAGPPGGVTAGDLRPWDRGSPEERWFRDHSSYLVPDFKGGLGALARLLAGVVVNLVVVGLVLFAVARPVGWAMHYLHEELHADKPALLERDTFGEMALAGIRWVGRVPAGEAKGPLTRYEVDLKPVLPEGRSPLMQMARRLMQVIGLTKPSPNDVCFDLRPYNQRDRDVCFNLEQATPGVIEVEAGRAKVVRQPRVRVTPASLRKPERCNGCDDLEQKAAIKEHPTLTLRDDVFVDERDLARLVDITGQPTATITSGLAGVTYPRFAAWMWQLSVGLVLGALAVALAVMSFRLGARHNDIWRAVSRALAGAGAAAFLLLIGLPWVVVWLPRTLSELAGTGPAANEGLSPTGSGFQDYLVPGGGLLALVAAAASQFLAAGRKGAGTGASKPWYRRLWEALSKRKSELKWYETSPTKILVAILATLAAVVLFVSTLQFAAANGPSGDLMGAAFIRDKLPGWLFLPEWVELVLVVAALGLLALAADAHAWSLYPFYKRRLSFAYLVRRIDPQHAERIPYHLPLPFWPPVPGGGDDPRWKGMRRPPKKPQLITCCAVNLSEYGRVPPGRRAASFTFSSTEIGGPVVGYATPRQYWKLPLRRRSDVTIASAMAISGAAFSPAMGKFNLGPIGAVLALANLRLGVWVANPRRVKAGRKTWRSWAFQRPHWLWFLREVTNKYPLNRRYVYVSDGGHWDNLGLVELLRRGCTEIYCISGAGDGALSFGTIGEAIALAREELGVEIKLDPSPLRAPTKGPEEPQPRELRRDNAKDKAAPFASASFVKGTFEFTRNQDAPSGTIYYVEANLTANTSFDVHTFAEAEPVFPDDSTGDQVFNHRQFESYRALGYHQTTRIFDPPPPSWFEKLVRKVTGS